MIKVLKEKEIKVVFILTALKAVIKIIKANILVQMEVVVIQININK